MTITVRVPRDSAALAVGADRVAHRIAEVAAARGIDIRLVRNSTRGLFWLEPLVEVTTSAGRVGYGPVEVDDIEAMFDAGFHLGRPHTKGMGLIDELPYLKRQERLTFARMGMTDPLSLADYEAHEGWLRGCAARWRCRLPTSCRQVLDSGLRGRGGAAFPAGIKWKTVAAAAAAQKYIVCNADEGDSGTYSDRMTMEGDPYMLIEGMTIAGLAVGATVGYLYVRSEYPHAIATMNEAIDRAESAGFLGDNVLGSAGRSGCIVRKAPAPMSAAKRPRDARSLEGKRGIVRAKPPLPALRGCSASRPSINNVITFASVPLILARGAALLPRLRHVGRSRGTLPIQLAGNIRHGGLVEKAFGVTLRELLFDFGGGTASGRPIKAVQVGGPLGAYVPESQWDVPLDYEAYAAVGAVVGHGGIVVHDDTADMAQMARYAMEFCAIESCGKCTPCRIGSTRGVEVIDRISAGDDRPQQVQLLRDLCDTMLHGSLCAMGGMTPYPVLSALTTTRRTSVSPHRSPGGRPPAQETPCSTTSLLDHGTPKRESNRRSP
jgi:formate dehydrogenase iron-sulfur subunit